jgi:uncharacterized membrane protein
MHVPLSLSLIMMFGLLLGFALVDSIILVVVVMVVVVAVAAAAAAAVAVAVVQYCTTKVV